MAQQQLMGPALQQLGRLLNEGQRVIAEQGQIFSVNFVGVATLQSTELSSHGYIPDAVSRIEKEGVYDESPVYLAVHADDVEIWKKDTLEQQMTIGMTHVIWAGPVEDAYPDMMAICFRHRTGTIICPVFRIGTDVHYIPQQLSAMFKANKLTAGKKAPYHALAGGAGGGNSGREVLSQTPWFVGKTPRAAVEEALKVGLVGDYVVRESESTPGAYVLVLKLKPTAFIEQKIKKTADGKYYIQGQQNATFRTIGQLISSDVRATRPAKGVVLGEKIAGGIARRASMTAARSQGKLDMATDVKAYDSVYLGNQVVFNTVKNVDAYKTLVRDCVVENSTSRKELRAMATGDPKRNNEKYQNVRESLPVAIVITPQLIRVVDRVTQETLTRAFIKDIPFTLEAPSRDGNQDKFAFIQQNRQGSTACHIFNVPAGLGHVLAEAISYYIEQAMDQYSAHKIASTNPFAATGAREAAPKSLFAKQIHRADLAAVKVLGAGQFGEVWLGKQSVKVGGVKREELRAVKMLKDGGSTQDKAEFIRESEVMLHFDHPNVTCIVGVLVQQKPWLCVLEFMECGDLRDVVISAKQKKATLEVGEQLDMCLQLALGCCYVAGLRLVHMDIAARNCLLGAGNLIKLADFGLTRPMDAGCTYYKLKERLAISIKWAAVEALERKMFDEKTDVWSFGVTAWEVFAFGEMPLKDIPLALTAKELRKGRRCLKPAECPDDIWGVVANCWNADVNQRWNFQQVCERLKSLQGRHKISQPRRDLGAFIKSAEFGGK